VRSTASAESAERDWISMVRSRLDALGLEHESEIHAGLAEHLEDV
jgi:hypothetical protein